jgi:hypothetical protein
VEDTILHSALNMIVLTRTNCTVPQKQVAVASSSVDQPSLERLATGKLLSSKVSISQLVLRPRLVRLILRWGNKSPKSSLVLIAGLRDEIQVRDDEGVSLSAGDVQIYIVVSRLTYHIS